MDRGVRGVAKSQTRLSDQAPTPPKHFQESRVVATCVWKAPLGSYTSGCTVLCFHLLEIGRATGSSGNGKKALLILRGVIGYTAHFHTAEFSGPTLFLCSVGLAIFHPVVVWGFPHSSVGKESACNAGDLGLIPGLGRSPGEGNGNPLQYSCLENPWTEEPGRFNHSIMSSLL